jgi:hypothetical protein
MDLQRTQQLYVEPKEVPSNSMAGSKSSVWEMNMSKTWLRRRLTLNILDTLKTEIRLTTEFAVYHQESGYVLHD